MATSSPPVDQRDGEAVPSSNVESTSQAPQDEARPTETLETEIEQEALPPADGGRAAWLVLTACSLLQAPVWGFSLAWGIIQDYYSSPASELVGNKSSVTVIGTTTTGILYLSSPMFFTVLTRWPHLRGWCGPSGLVITVLGFLASSFSRRVWLLIATQGVLCALGSGMMFAPSTLYLDEWFVRRKGLAYGIMWAGKSTTGAAIPFIIDASLERFGYRTTMLAWTLAVAFFTAPLLFVLRPRIPLPSAGAASSRRRVDTSCFRLRTFWVLQTGNVLQSMGYFLPSAYLPGYATTQLQVPRATGTLLLALLNAISVPANVVFGMLNDRLRVTHVQLISTLPSAAAVLLLWGPAGPRYCCANDMSSGSSNNSSSSSYYGAAEATGASSSSCGGCGGSGGGVALLVLFALAYGFFAGGFSSTWSGVLQELQKQSPTLDTGLVFGLLAGGRGIGNVVSGPISVALMGRSNDHHHGGQDMGSSGGSDALSHDSAGGWAYGSEYGPMILFTGVSVLLGAWGWLCQWLWRPSSPSSSSSSSSSAPLSWWPTALTPSRWQRQSTSRSCCGGGGAIMRRAAGRGAAQGQQRQRQSQRQHQHQQLPLQQRPPPAAVTATA